VLGGGGGRGLAHLGFIRALEQAGVPVDVVAGSSMGACVGAVYARDLTAAATLGAVRAFSRGMRLRAFLRDVTFPHLAKTTGRVFHARVRGLLGAAHLTDMWVDYYCAVTNVTRNCTSQMQHEGDAARSVGASMSYAGAVPPTCLDGDMLIDSCYSGNLPVRRAIELGAECIFVVDVSALRPLGRQDFGSTLNGWKVLLRKLKMSLGWEEAEKDGNLPPSGEDVIDRVCQGTSLRELEIIKNTPGCYYIPLPVNYYSARDFSVLDELAEIGYEAGKSWFAEMKACKKLAGLAIPNINGKESASSDDVAIAVGLDSAVSASAITSVDR
jgi:lysophospholipid hydrolase